MSSKAAAASASTSAHPSSRQSSSAKHSAPKSEADHARDLQRERERAAAKEAQRQHWERTRGAGSSVLALYDDEFRTKAIDTWQAEDVLPTLEQVHTKKYDPVEVPSADLLLTRGISEYTMLPKVLGRGKFSTVFLAAKNGEKYAIKHTALFPHHPLISTRLLREPTLLAELPPHPNLVTVNETIRTPGHFYLVEEYLGGYVTLEALIPLLSKQPPDQPAKLPDDVAEKVFQQLISVVNSIHTPLQICHRDIKPENILVHPVSLQLKLLDFGLATHFSRSEPKLTTCCGSPAFHCPEIVKALASPPGSVMYWGPEVDAWTCGITMLRCLTGVLYPLGAQHTSLRSMAIRAQRSVGMVSSPSLREKIGKLVDMDSMKRMRYFQEMNEEQERLLGEPQRDRKEFKSTTFIPTEPSHTMRLPLLVGAAAEQAENLASGQRSPMTSSRTTPNTSRAPSPSPLRHAHGNNGASPQQAAPPGTKTMVLLNPTGQPPQRVLSFIKYCLRCAGILYHCWPDASSAIAGSGMSASMLPLSATNGSVAELSVPPSPSLSNRAAWATMSSERLEFPTLGGGGGAGGNSQFHHIHIFQCVLHLPEPVEEPEQQLSLVQTIMAAFGRRAAPNNKRSLSQPPKPKTTDAAAVAAAAEGSEKAAADAAAAAAAAGNGGKTAVRCLPFWMVIRLSKSNYSSSSGGGGAVGTGPGGKPGYQRSSSTAGRRSRTTSAVVTSGGAGGSMQEFGGTRRSTEHSPESREPGQGQTHPVSGRVSLDGHGKEGKTFKVSESEGVAAATGANGNRPSAERQRTGSYSRAHSRQRLKSRVSHVNPSKPKVFLYVSDDRALPALKKALSVGGTYEGSDVEDEGAGTASSGAAAGTEGKEKEKERASQEESPRTPSSPGFYDRKARPSVLRSQTFASSSGMNGLHATSSTTNGLPFPSVDEDGGDVQEMQRGRPSAPMASRRSESHRAIRTQSQASVRPGSIRGSSITSEELERRLDALQSALRPVLTRSGRGRNERENGLATVEQARVNLAGLLQTLQDAERAQGPVLQAALSPITFQLFSVLTPVLGLEPVRARANHQKAGRKESPVKSTTTTPSLLASPLVTRNSGQTSPIESESEKELSSKSSTNSNNGSNNTNTATLPSLLSSSSSLDSLDEPTPMSKMARSALDLAAQYSSAREMFLAVQERLDLLISQAEENQHQASSDRDEVPGTPAATPMEARKSGHQARRPATKGWDGGLELDGLLGLLCIVIPRIKTRKPHNFSESLANLVPRAAKALLGQTRSRKTEQQSQSKQGASGLPEGPVVGLTFRQQNALRVLKSLVELTKVTNAWEVRCLADDQKTDSTMLSSAATLKELPKRSADTGVMFFATVAALVPHLPGLRQMTDGTVSGLSEAFFFTKNPKYALQRHNSASASATSSPSMGTPSSHEETLMMWKEVASAIEGMHASVYAIAFQTSSQSALPASPKVSAPVESGHSQAALASAGAFLCLVHMLALRTACSNLGVDQPSSTWTAPRAHEHLAASLPMVLAGLKSHATMKIGTGGAGSAVDETKLVHLPIEPLEDAALMWILWCFDVLEDAPPKDRVLLPEMAIALVQSLSMNAALSASAARLISFLLVKQIITHHVSEQTAADLLFDIVSPECPFANLRSAGVGMVRDIIDLKLEKRKAIATLPVADEGGMLTPIFLQRLRSVLFTLPAGFERIREASDKPVQVVRMRAFLDDYSPWLSECCHTLYYLIKRDQDNLTGIQEPALQSELRRTFVAPLQALISDWQSTGRKTAESDGDAEQRQCIDGIVVSLGVIGMGLSLVEDVLGPARGGLEEP
ncbi:hypothetical protein CF319_g4011 [Tilletia indica]|nr:hypothetical protein CF319_g4011 [Tilletia indica]